MKKPSASDDAITPAHSTIAKETGALFSSIMRPLTEPFTGVAEGIGNAGVFTTGLFSSEICFLQEKKDKLIMQHAYSVRINCFDIMEDCAVIKYKVWYTDYIDIKRNVLVALAETYFVY